MARPSTPKPPKQVASLNHPRATRPNIPTAELQAFAEEMEAEQGFRPAAYPRARPLAEGESRERDADLDPQIVWNGARIRLTPAQVRQLVETGEAEVGDAQLVWRGKDRQDWSDLIVQTPPLYIQEKVHPKAIIDDLKRATARPADDAPDLFGDFNGVPVDARTEFYEHQAHWSNRMILGDSLSVMASLAERERLKGQVQCIYFDPPYGIKFNSNWQVSTQSRDVKDGKREDVSREPEQVKAFRDTWKDGIHSYLTYLRDRLTVARELLTESGSIFVQIGDGNIHRVRALMEEVFDAENEVSQIVVLKTSGQTSEYLPGIADYVLWFSRSSSRTKYRPVFRQKHLGEEGTSQYRVLLHKEKHTSRRLSAVELHTGEFPGDYELFAPGDMTSQKPPGYYKVSFQGREFLPGKRFWTTHPEGVERLARAQRLHPIGNTMMYRRFLDDFPVFPISNVWSDVGMTGFSEDKIYVVQSSSKIVERCILMATDPGDLVLDPTCGSGTTAYVAEQWGRRWITIDTSRVALALARTRLMSARYPYYLLADSVEGRRKEQDVSGRASPTGPVHGDVRQGFVYERAPHVTLKSIANNSAIDEIWERWQATLEPLRAELNALVERGWEEWEIPRDVVAAWPEPAKAVHARWWEARIARQREIDASIAKAADVEMLYDRPYLDPNRVRVAGPFTVESLSPHRVVPSDQQELMDEVDAAEGRRRRALPGGDAADFAAVVLEHLRTAGVQQASRGERITFDALAPWPGTWIGAEGRFMEADSQRRAAVFIGPEFGTLSRSDLVAAAREASDNRFDVLIATAFNFDAHASDLGRLGGLTILKAKMNPDLHMAGELKNTGKGNLFVVFGEPDIDILPEPGEQIRVRVNGVDVFDPNTGEVRSADTKGVAAWFIDTDYDEESFFVRHAYFLGANDPYKALKTSLKAEIDEAAWASLYRDVSRPFARPSTGRIAVKVINHFGDEVMKVYRV